jgi:hypothetical protein
VAAVCTSASAGCVPAHTGQSGCNKRLRCAAPLIKHLIRVLTTDTDPTLTAERPGLITIADNDHTSAELDRFHRPDHHLTLIAYDH